MVKTRFVPLLLLLLGTAVFGYEEGDFQRGIKIDIPQGSYGQDQVVRISCSLENVTLMYRFAENVDTHFTLYDKPIYLSAVPGEERRYTLIAAAFIDEAEAYSRSHSIVIDKSVPLRPEVSHVSGTYSETQNIELTAGKDSVILYSLNESIADNPQLYSAPLVLQIYEGKLKNYVLSAYAVDPAGNMSGLKTWTYVIDGAGSAADGLTVYSPVEGKFANKQLLYVDESDFDSVEFSLNGDIFQQYTGPVDIDMTGGITLAVRGIRGDAVSEKTIEYSVVPSGVTISGIRNGLNTAIAFVVPRTYYYCYQERPPERYDYSGGSTVSLTSVQNSVTRGVIRLREEGADEEFRFYYILDSRIPENPRIHALQSIPVSSDTVIAIEAADYADTYYTTDGSTPDKNSNAYTGPFVLKVPENTASGSLAVKARSFHTNGQASGEAVLLVYFDTVPPAAPVISYRTLDDGIVFSAGDPENTPYYSIAIDGKTPLPPDRNSPRMDSDMTVEVPEGGDFQVILQAAAIDDAGNVSPVMTAGPVRIDRLAPEKPSIKIADGVLTISGSGTVYYSLTGNGAIPEPSSITTVYTDKISLAADDAKRLTYRCAAFAEDEAGNRSRLSYTGPYYLDKKIPDPPVISGIPAGNATNGEYVTLNAKVAADDIEIYYTFTSDGTSPAEPDKSSNIYSDPVTLEGAAGKSVTYSFRFRSFSRSTGNFSTDKAVVFDIDRQKPSLPVVTGIEDGGHYNLPVTISIGAMTAGDFFYYLLSSSSAPQTDPFGAGSVRYESPLTVDIEQGTEKRYTFSYGAADKAGNRITAEKPIVFTLDKKGPPIPYFLNYEKLTLTNKDITLNPVKMDDDIYYEIVEGRSNPRIPGSGSALLAGGLTLKGADHKRTNYSVSLIAIDKAGNVSEGISVYNIIIDKTQPALPPFPSLVSESERRIVVSWDLYPDQELYYSLRIDNLLAYDYVRYTSPFIVEIPDFKESVTLNYFSANFLGTRSDVQTAVVRSEAFSSILVRGVDQGGYYDDKVILYKKNQNDTIRYEISTESGRLPRLVSALSASMTGPLEFDVSSGEIRNFTVRLRKSGDDDGSGGAEELLSFTIDKAKPVPPVLDGVDPEFYIQNDRQFSFLKADEDIYYTLYAGETQVHDFKVYEEPFALTGKDGEIRSYAVIAYTEDRAGNRSDQRTWTITIDREIIYVSDRGHDSNDGSRSKPFRSLAKAVSASLSSSRKTIFLAQGAYSLTEPIAVTRDIRIEGGRTPDRWTTEPDAKSVISVGADGAFSIGRDTAVTLSYLSFEAGNGKETSLFFVTDGALTLHKSSIMKRNASNPQLISQTGGIVAVNDSLMSTDKIREGSVVTAAQGIFSMRDSKITNGTGTAGVVLLRLTDMKRVDIFNSTLQPGTGAKTVCIMGANSTITVSSSTLSSGTGAIDSTLIDLNKGRLVIADSFLGSDTGSRIVKFVSLRSAVMEITGSEIYGNSKDGMLLLQTFDSDITMRGSSIEYSESYEFNYLVKGYNSSVKLHTNVFKIGRSQDFIGVSLSGGSLEFFQNTCIVSGCTNFTKMFFLDVLKTAAILNNICITTGISHDTFLESNTPASIDMRGNNVYGWTQFLKADKILISTAEGSVYDASGIRVGSNQSEPYESTFKGLTSDPLLSTSSRCNNRAVSIAAPSYTAVDIKGKVRPNGKDGVFSDIGAFEAE